MILADREALTRAEKAAQAAQHPLARAAHEADARYLRGLIDEYEYRLFDLHGLT